MPLAVIRESILEPSTDLYRIGSESVRVSLRDGREVRGLARNRDSYSLQVIDGAGDLHMIGMDEVAALEISEASPMPEDYGARLSREEFDNLLAFLTRQSLRAKDGNQQ